MMISLVLILLDSSPEITPFGPASDLGFFVKVAEDDVGQNRGMVEFVLIAKSVVLSEVAVLGKSNDPGMLDAERFGVFIVHSGRKRGLSLLPDAG